MYRFASRGISLCILCAVVLSSTLLVFSHSALAQREFRNGHIKIKDISRPLANGPATINWEVTTSYSGVGAALAKPAGTINQSSIETEDGIDLKSVPFTDTTFTGTQVISASSLDCSTPQDICRGCISSAFTAETLTADIENDDPQNRSIGISSRYNVLRDTNGQPAAPVYSGPLLLDVRKGANLSINLNDHINYPGGYTCSLVPATFRNGLIENPTSSTGSLFVTEGCSLNWNMANAPEIVVGNQFMTQVRIKATGAVNGTTCVPETIVTFQIQIGCSSEQLSTSDASCFLCADVNIEPPLTGILNQLTTSFKAVKKRKRRDIRNIRRAREDDQGRLKRTVAFRKIIRNKVAKYFKAFRDNQASVLTLESIQTQCAAASPEFCSSTSNLEQLAAIDEFIAAEATVVEGYRKAILKSSRARGFNPGRSNKRADKFREKLATDIQNVKDLRSTIPNGEDQCGGANTTATEDQGENTKPLTPETDGETETKG